MSTNNPNITPALYTIEIIVRFSLWLWFVLNSSNIPIPLPVSSPDRSVPTDIRFDAYNSVIIILLAQLGIKPIKLDIK